MSARSERVLVFHARQPPEVTVTITVEGPDEAPRIVSLVNAPNVRKTWGLSRLVPVGADLNILELQLVVDTLGMALADLTREDKS